MRFEEYIECDATALAELVRAGETSKEELLQCALHGIELFDNEIQALIETYEPVSNATENCGLFYGVPFLLKDVGAPIEGLLQESGSRMGQGIRAKQNINLSNRYLSAGFQIFGRTKCPEMAFNITTESRMHGPVHNPWDLSRSAGGSSGGAGAATAARYVPMAEANDGGGSIRIPASCNGVVGLKPSRGRISSAPNASEYLNGLSVPLVTSRSIRDSAAMLDLMAGPEIGDPYPVEPPAYSYLEVLSKPLLPLKIGLMTHAWQTDLVVESACIDAVNQVGKFCESLGHQVDYGEPKLGVSWDEFIEANAQIWCINITKWIDDLAATTGRQINSENLEFATLGCYKYGKRLGAQNVLRAFEIFNRVSRSVCAFHKSFDVLVCPTLPTPPKPLGTYDSDKSPIDGLEWSRFILSATPFTPVANVTGQPAISLPLAWTESDLPIGVQLTANLGREDIILQLARQLEDGMPWNMKIPSLLKTCYIRSR